MQRSAVILLGSVLGLQSLRAFLPLLVYVLRDRFGLSTVALGGIGFALFGAAFLFPPAAGRARGRLVPGAAVALVAARAALQFWTGDPVGSLVFAAIGVLAFAMLLAAAADRPGPGLSPAVAFLLGALLDTAIHGAAGTRDLHWGGAGPGAAALVLLALTAVAALRTLRGPTPGAGARAGGWIAWGPYLLLHVEWLGNVARFSSRTGLPTATSGTLVALGLAAAAVLGSVAARRHGGGRLAAVVAAAALGAGLLGGGTTGTAAWPLLLLAQAGAALLLVRATAAPATATPSLHAGPGGAATAAFGGGFLLFLIGLFAHYAGYDLPLPGSRTSVALAIAAILFAAALPSRARATLPGGSPRGLAAGAATIALLPLLHGTPRLAPPAPPPDHLRIISFNLHNGFDERGAFAFDRMVASLRDAAPDVVALQEVSRGWAINGSADLYELAREVLGLDGVPAPSVATDWGNAVFARGPVTLVGTTPLPPDLPLPRAVTEVHMPLAGGRSLAVFATHYHHLEGDAQIRAEQSRFLAQTLHPGRDAVLLGDFNDEGASPCLTILRDAGWMDVADHPRADAGGSLATFPAVAPSRRIDTILYREGLAVTDTRVAPPWGSDHRAAMADFALAPAP
jgi:endonuclease/exonuclease/phosphatase family metal-dependent hydrolase